MKTEKTEERLLKVAPEPGDDGSDGGKPSSYNRVTIGISVLSLVISMVTIDLNIQQMAETIASQVRELDRYQRQVFDAQDRVQMLERQLEVQRRQLEESRALECAR